MRKKFNTESFDLESLKDCTLAELFKLWACLNSRIREEKTLIQTIDSEMLRRNPALGKNNAVSKSGGVIFFKIH